MPDFPYACALIVGVGSGISASLARRLTALGVRVGLAARDVDKLGALAAETGATPLQADATQATSVAALFEEATRRIGEPDVVVYNASARARGPLAELDAGEVERALAVTAFGAFLVAQQAARRMAPRGRNRRTGRTACCRRTASRRAISTCCASRAAPGRSRSSSGPGSRSSSPESPPP